MPTQAGKAVSGTTSKASPGGGGAPSSSHSKGRVATSGGGNKMLKAVTKAGGAPKRTAGGTKQNPGKLVPMKNVPSQGQGGKAGPATKSGRRK